MVEHVDNYIHEIEQNPPTVASPLYVPRRLSLLPHLDIDVVGKCNNMLLRPARADDKVITCRGQSPQIKDQDLLTLLLLRKLGDPPDQGLRLQRSSGGSAGQWLLVTA